MKKIIIALILSVLSIGINQQTFSATYHCDFSTTLVSNHDEIVEQCFEKVPYSEDSRNHLVNVVRQYIDLSILADHYELKNQWREQLDTISETSFRSDFEMHHAFSNLFKSFRNRHYRYKMPLCYSTFDAVIPAKLKTEIVDKKFPLPSSLSELFQKKEQILFLEPENNDEIAFLYQQQTDIDLENYYGMRIKTINGVDAIEAAANFAFEHGFGEEKSIAFQVLLNDNHFFIRSPGSSKETKDIELVLIDENGIQHQLTLPFMMYRNTLSGGDIEVIQNRTFNLEDLSAYCHHKHTDINTSGYEAKQKYNSISSSLPEEMRERRKYYSGHRKNNKTEKNKNLKLSVISRPCMRRLSSIISNQSTFHNLMITQASYV